MSLLLWRRQIVPRIAYHVRGCAPESIPSRERGTSKEARAMGKWGQIPTYTVSYDPQEIERSPFRVSEGRGAKIGSLVRGLLGGEKNARNQHALRSVEYRTRALGVETGACT